MKTMLAIIAPLLLGISLNAAPYQQNTYTINTTSQANALAAPFGQNIQPEGNNLYLGSTSGGVGNTGTGTTAAGINSFNGSGAGANDSAFGFQSLTSDTSGGDNSAFGATSLSSDTIGSFNTALGWQALVANISGSNNIAIGYNAGSALLLSSNIDIGNFGLAGDVQIIRIGSGQLTTYIAGAITGNGGGLTNLNANQFTNGIGYLGTNSSIPIIPSGLDPTGTNLYSSALISGSLTNQGSMTASNGFASYAQHVPAAVTVGASPFSYTNVSPIAQSCYLSGATAYAVALNGVTVYASIAGDSYVMLQPTNVVKVTYTVAPTLLTNSW
jgi:hypothetical protein